MICPLCSKLAKRSHRGRCEKCYRAQLAALSEGECRRCDRTRRVWPDDGLCGRCAQVVARNEPPGVRPCQRCGRTGRIAAAGVCQRCWNREPSRPYVYAAGARDRLVTVPDWFDDFVAYVAVRYSSFRAVDVLRDFVAHVNTVGTVHPAALAAEPPARMQRCLVPFLTSRGLILAGEDDEIRRARERRRRRVTEVPAPFRPAVTEFAVTLVRRRERAIRLDLRVEKLGTLERRLATLRDLARFCEASRPPIPSWETVARDDVEAFLARRPSPSATELGDLHKFFRWARRQHIVLASPVDGMRIRQNMSFRGAVLSVREQRRLYNRWTNGSGVHPHEAFFGLAALIHGASTAEIQKLTIDDINIPAHSIRLGRRGQFLLDPDTWTALQACLRHREQLPGENPHVLVNRITASTDRAAAPSYFASLLLQAETTPQRLRTTRLSTLAVRADPVIVAAAFGVTHKSAAYYRNTAHHEQLDSPAASR